MTKDLPFVKKKENLAFLLNKKLLMYTPTDLEAMLDKIYKQKVTL